MSTKHNGVLRFCTSTIKEVFYEYSIRRNGQLLLGDCIYANHRLDYPSIASLQSHPHSSISAELTGLFTASSLKYRNVLSQSNFNNVSSTYQVTPFCFGFNSDNIDDRISWNLSSMLGNAENEIVDVGTLIYYNNNGYTGTTNNHNSTNALYRFSYRPATGQSFVANTTGGTTICRGLNMFNYISGVNATLYSEVQWAGCCDGESLALFITQKRFSTNTTNYYFFYVGKLLDINTGFNYYSASLENQTIFLIGTNNPNNPFGGNTIPLIDGSHYIASSGKILLSSGDAQYSIVCADGQSPTAQWATDMYVFDNNVTLGYPAIGRVRNLLLAQGTYTIGKPVRIQGTVQPDNGFNSWLPVGTFGGKVVLMRCYSSVDL